MSGTKTGRILIADDDKSIADAWREALEMDGHTVSVVYDGAEAVEQLKNDTFDIIITDFVMPEKGGLFVGGMARLHQQSPKLIVVSGFLYGLSGQMKFEALKKLGVQHILEKPVDLSLLSELVFQLLEPEDA